MAAWSVPLVILLGSTGFREKDDPVRQSAKQEAVTEGEC